MTLLMLPLGLLVLVALMVLIYAVCEAPEGFEDGAGFHPLDRQPLGAGEDLRFAHLDAYSR